MNIPWTEYLRRRIKHEEKNIPWWVNNKTRLNSFCVENGIPAPKILETWSHPNEIDLSHAPEVFVLKPNVMSSSMGVMLLRRLENGKFHEALKNRELTLQDIHAEQERVYEKCKVKKSYRVFIEEFIQSPKSEGRIPFDYKIYCFYDEAKLVQQINRNAKPTSTAFFDGGFGPFDVSRNVTSSWKHYQLGEPVRPPEWAEMLEIATRLTKLIQTPFMRVDMFVSERGPLVGELTPAPGGPYHGTLYKFTDTYDQELGAAWADAEQRMKDLSLDQ